MYFYLYPPREAAKLQPLSFPLPGKYINLKRIQFLIQKYTDSYFRRYIKPVCGVVGVCLIFGVMYLSHHNILSKNVWLFHK
jgi:hypothetical protein